VNSEWYRKPKTAALAQKPVPTAIFPSQKQGSRQITAWQIAQSVGSSVQSTAGSRGVRISLINAGYTSFGGGVRVLATHSIRQFHLHFLSRASPCSIRFRTGCTKIVINCCRSLYTVHYITQNCSYNYKIYCIQPSWVINIYMYILKCNSSEPCSH
jgi:hypothetical protein